MSNPSTASRPRPGQPHTLTFPLPRTLWSPHRSICSALAVQAIHPPAAPRPHSGHSDSLWLPTSPPSQPKLSIPSLLLALALATVPLSVGSTIVAVFVRVMMERMGISGHVSTLLADGVVGALSGAAVLAWACGAMLPLLGYALSGEIWEGVGRCG